MSHSREPEAALSVRRSVAPLGTVFASAPSSHEPSSSARLQRDVGREAAEAGTNLEFHGASDANAALSRELRRVVLLAGRVGNDPFGASLGRSVLDLPVLGGRTVLALWIERLEEFAIALGREELHTVIAIDRASPPPSLPAPSANSRVRVEIERDAAEFRGTGGVLRDLTRTLRSEDRVAALVASHVPAEPLADSLEGIGVADEGVVVAPFGAGDLTSVFLLRASRLARVPNVGFVDLKEQALSGGADLGVLRVVRRPRGSVLPLRTLSEYVRALRAVARSDAEAGTALRVQDDPFAEEWRPLFRIVERGAEVSESAVLQDSVVLAGATVEADAVLVRSIVGPRAVVRRGQCLTDRAVTA